MNYYELLNLQPTATPDEIRAAYARERASRIAQAGDDDVRAGEERRALDEAYATLIEPGRRSAYDRSLRAEPASAALMIPGQPAPSTILADAPIPMVQQACPFCQAPNPIQATICRECGRQMTRPCPKCGQAVVLGQTVCSRCETFIPEYDQQRFAQGVAISQQIQQERRAADVRTVAADQVYRVGVRYGIAFWMIVIGLCIGLAVLATILSSYASR